MTGSFRQRLKERRATAAWWGVLALLLQMLVPVGQAVPMGSADGLPRTLVLCSAIGGAARTVPLPGSSAPTAESPACAVCLAQAIGGACDLPALSAWLFPPAGSGIHIDPPVEVRAHGVMPGLPRARDPPSVTV